MVLFSSKHWGRISWASLFALGLSANAQEWWRHFRIGASAGMNIKTDFQTSGTFSVSGSNPGDAIPGINHEYDNGYVRLDATGNAAPPGGPTQTTNFSYTDSSQYDPAANTLTFQGTRSYTVSGLASENDQPDLGFDMAYGATIRKWKTVSLGFELGFNMNLVGPEDRNPMNADDVAARHQYSTAGIPPGSFPPPNTPGNPSGSGSPAMDDRPTDLGDFTTTGTVTGSRSLDVTLYNLRLGPLFRWEFYPRWTLNASAGMAFTILDGSYSFDEQLTVSGSTTRNAGKFGATEFSWGGFGGVVFMYDTRANWEPYLGAHFYSMQDMSVASAGRSAKLDLGAAVYISAGINWTF